MVLSVVPEVFEVNDRHSRDHQFQLLLIEDGNKVTRDNLVESFQEAPQLWLDAVSHLHLAHELDVLLLVLLHHGDVVATRCEVLGLRLTKLCDLGEGEGGEREGRGGKGRERRGAGRGGEGRGEERGGEGRGGEGREIRGAGRERATELNGGWD